MKDLAKRYSILIEWSDADDAYIATVDELHSAKIHGNTRAEALREAEELIASWLVGEEQSPAPRQFDRHYAAEGTPWTEPGYDAAASVGLTEGMAPASR
jgi:predicted RNase H-like HicB family nuclease